MNLSDKLLKQVPESKNHKSFLDNLTSKQLDELLEYRTKYHAGVFDGYPLTQASKFAVDAFKLEVGHKTISQWIRENKDVNKR
tara:strand:- start:3525 stop:3773 length:249 start_codon:yes stop_codon:yes gene_type:complete